MPDVFDTVADSPTDVFDQVASDQHKDVFDEVAGANPLTEQATKETRAISAAKAIQSFKTPAQMQVEEQKMIAPDIAGAAKGVGDILPKSLGQAAKMLTYTPVEDAPHILKQAYDVVTGTPVEQAIPESQVYKGFLSKPLPEQARIITRQVAPAILAAAGLRESLAPRIGEANAIKPSNAQVEAGPAPLGVETRPAGEVAPAGHSDYVKREAQGAEPGGQVPPVQETPVSAQAEGVLAPETLPETTQPQKEGDINVQAKETQIGTPEGPPPQQGEIVEPESVRQPESGQQQQPLRDQGPGEVTTGASSTPAPEPISTKNAYTEEQRAIHELPEAEQAAKRGFGTVWDEAAAQAEKDPLIGQRLVEELNNKPRPINDTENALLLRQEIAAQKEHSDAINAVNSATNEPDLTAAKSRLEVARNNLQAVYDATKRAGTKGGQALAARQMLAKEDYSLAKMEARRRAANDGRPLDERQLGEVKDLHAKIADLQSKLDAHETARAFNQEFNKLVEQSKKEARAAKTTTKFNDFLDRKANEARARIKARRAEGRLYGGIDPEPLIDEAIIGASHIAKGLTKFADWSTQMVKEFGDKIRPFLKDIWDRARSLHDVASREYKSKIKPELTPQEKLAEAVGKVNDRLERAIAVKKGLAEPGVPRPKVPPDLDTEALRVELNRLQAIAHEANRLENAKSIARRNLEFAREGLVKPTKATPLVPDAELRAMRNEISELRKGPPEERLLREIKKRMDDIHARLAKKKSPDKLERYKDVLAQKTIGYTEKIERGDFTKPVKESLKLDAAAFKMRANLQKLKNEFERGVAKEAYKNKSPAQKFWDHFVGVERAMKLSGPSVFGKLGVAAAVREGLAPIEAAGGYGVSKVFPKLAAGTRYGADLKTTVKAEIKAKAAFFTKGMQDAWQNIRGKETELEAIGDKYGRLPDFWYNRIGKMHAAIKAPVKRAEFTRSLEQRMNAAVKAGEDINHPEVMTRLANEAVMDANRSIFQENNAVSKWFESLDRISPAAGRVRGFLFPILKIPTNIFKELVNLHVGAPIGAVRTGMAYWKGIETLPVLQREAIIRQLVKGSIGGAGLLWGYYNSDKVRAFFKSVPAFFQHTPMAMIIEEGGYLKQLEQGGAAAKEGQKELKYMAKTDIPFMYTITDITKALDAHDSNAFLGWIHNMTQSTVVPQISSQIAKGMDKPGTFPQNMAEKPRYRVPANTLQAIELGIPGLRQNVPEKAAAGRAPSGPLSRSRSFKTTNPLRKGGLK